MKEKEVTGTSAARIAAGQGSAPAGRSCDREPGAVVLFDGVCNLCNGFVLFVIDRDPRGYFHFGPLQEAEARRLFQQHGLPGDGDLSSVVLLEGGRCYRRSTAALRIVRRLGGFWPLLYGFVVVPRPVRDAVYEWVARNRYRWFGRTADCRIPTPELRSRFLSPDPGRP